MYKVFKNEINNIINKDNKSKLYDDIDETNKVIYDEKCKYRN